MSIKDFVVEEKLGQGAFGVVQKVKRLSDNQHYALKKVKYMDLKEKDKKNALNQIRILASIDHPNVIKYKEAFFQEDSKNLYTVMELASNGDLANRIKAKIRDNDTFYEYEIWAIGKDIINGISALHQRNIIHRDIKPANIFFAQQDIAKIGDLNVSLLMKNNLAYTQTGTPYYASPEVWNNQPYGYQCDIWSLGCVLYEMCCLKKPFEAKDIDHLYKKVKKLQYDPLPYRLSYDLINVIEKCLSYRTKRISLNELKRVFNLHNAPDQLKLEKQKGSKVLMDTIKLPANKVDFIQNLPKSNYNNPEEKSQIKTQTSIEENPSILDRFLKPQNRLPSKRSYLVQAKSEKNLNIYEKRVPIPKSPNFKDAINFKSPPKSFIMDHILAEQLSLRRRKIKLAMV